MSSVPSRMRLRHFFVISIPIVALFLSLPASGSPPTEGISRPGRTTLLGLAANDVVAFVGGADVAAAQHTGHLETFLTVACRNLQLRFRNFGWEGDTVFLQHREVGFPSLRANLQKAGITVVFVQFGRAEALDSTGDEGRFISAYGKFLDDSLPAKTRVVLIAPPPFEHAAAPLPDLSRCNRRLSNYVQDIRELGRTRHWPVVDLFTAFSPQTNGVLMLTDDGLQLTPQGHARVALAFVRELGFDKLAAEAGAPTPGGAWQNRDLEAVRQQVIAKNVLWFNYSRPQNWAFLGGDRVTQPSSHDHRDATIRWFPGEMEKYLPLINAAEEHVQELSRRVPLE